MRYSMVRLVPLQVYKDEKSGSQKWLNWWSEKWNDGVTPWNASSDTPAGGIRGNPNRLKPGEVGREQPKQTKLWKVVQRWIMLPICRESIKYPWLECPNGLTNLRMYGPYRERHRNVSLPQIGSWCGWVKIFAMKNHCCRNLKGRRGSTSQQAQSRNLKVHGKIGPSEQGKVSDFQMETGWRRMISSRTGAKKQWSNRRSSCNGNGGMATSRLEQI